MPEQRPNPVDQKLRLTIEEKIVGDDLLGHLKKVEAALRRTQKSVGKYDKQFERHAKTIRQALPSVERYQKQQERLSKSLSISLEPMRKQLDLLRKTRQEMSATDRVSQSLGRSLSRVAGILGAGGLGYMAVQRIRQMMDSRLNLALMGGADQIRLLRSWTAGVNTTAAIDLAARFQQQSPFARFGLGDQSLRGLVALQKKLEPVGLDLANDLILEVTKSLEPDKLRSFLQTATVDPQRALLGAASGGNVEAITSALNALQVGDLKAENRLDPMLAAATEFKETGNRLADAFDKLAENITRDLLPVIQSLASTIEKVAGVVGNLSTKELIGYGLGGYVGYRALRGLGGAALRGIGRGLRMPVGMPGVPPGGFGGPVPTWSIPGMRPALPAPGGGLPGLPGRFIPPGGLGPHGFPVVSPLILPAGGVVGYGLAGGAAAGGIYTAVKSGQTAYNERAALRSIERSMQDRGLFDVAAHNKLTAKTELDRLRAKRQQIDAMLLSSAPTGDMGIHKDWFGRMLGFYGNFAQSDLRQIDRLRQQRADIQRQVQELRAKPTTNIVSDVFESIRSGLDKAKNAAEKFKVGLDNMIEKGLQWNLKVLQQQAARRQELELKATEQGALTQLSRLEFDLARTTPFGNIGAMGQYLDLQKQLNREIESLTAVMNNIDQSTLAGRIEAMQINQQIKGLRLEEKTRGLEMTRAMLDSIQAQAFNAGKFEKIIFTQDRNVRAGLSMGILNPSYPQIFGSTGHPSKGRHPVHLNPATNAVEAVDNLGKAARDLSGYLQNLIGEDESDNPLRPGAAGFATLN